MYRIHHGVALVVDIHLSGSIKIGGNDRPYVMMGTGVVFLHLPRKFSGESPWIRVGDIHQRPPFRADFSDFFTSCGILGHFYFVYEAAGKLKFLLKTHTKKKLYFDSYMKKKKEEKVFVYSETRENLAVNSTGYFSSLSEEQQARYAMAYISILQQQLAQAEIRHRRTLEALDVFESIQANLDNGGVRIKRLKMCRSCLATSKEDKVWRCDVCRTFRCEKCSTDTRKILKCQSGMDFCEGCNQKFLLASEKGQEEKDCYCLGCYASRECGKIAKENQEKLHRREITRNEAVIRWSFDDYLKKTGILLPMRSWNYVCAGLRKYLSKGWITNIANVKDFPELEKNIYLVIFPSYSNCPKSVELVNEILDKFLPEDPSDDLVRRAHDAIWNILGQKAKTIRTTLTVGEILNNHFVWEDIPFTGTLLGMPHFSAEKKKEIDEKFPGFFEQFFD